MKNDLMSISPYVRLARDQTIAVPWYLPERIIFDYELMLLKEGELIVTVEDREYHGIPGDIFFFRPGQRHSIRRISAEAVRQPHVHFDLFEDELSPKIKVSYKNRDQMSWEELKLIREDNCPLFDLKMPSMLRLENIDHFDYLLTNVIEEYQNRQPFSDISLKQSMLRLWVYFLRTVYWQNNPVSGSNMNQLGQIRDFLDANLTRSVTLDEVAQRFNISKYYLDKIFKKVYQTTPIQYHQNKRIEKAKELIQYGNMSLGGIAEALGYNDINSFSRAFKKVDGVAPSYYRQKRSR